MLFGARPSFVNERGRAVALHDLPSARSFGFDSDDKWQSCALIINHEEFVNLSALGTMRIFRDRCIWVRGSPFTSRWSWDLDSIDRIVSEGTKCATESLSILSNRLDFAHRLGFKRARPAGRRLCNRAEGVHVARPSQPRHKGQHCACHVPAVCISAS